MTVHAPVNHILGPVCTFCYVHYRVFSTGPYAVLASDSGVTSPTQHPKRKRSWSRAVFSNLQRKGLEKRFDVQKYVTKPDRRQLAAMLGLTDAQVRTHASTHTRTHGRTNDRTDTRISYTHGHIRGRTLGRAHTRPHTYPRTDTIE